MQTEDTAELGAGVADLLRAAQAAGPGWSQRFGGPEGVIRAADAAQEELRRQSAEVAAIKASALNEMLRTRSKAQLAKELGISRARIDQMKNYVKTVREW